MGSTAARTPRPLPRRDRVAILSALAGVTALAWTYLVVLASRMDSAGAMAGMRAWTSLDLVLMFLMWAVMMVGMMLPSAASMVLIYAAVARKAAGRGTPVAPTGSFVAGYLAVWTAFSAAATAAQWALERAALLSPMMVATSPALGAALLIGAGAYQLSPWKDTCLQQCRAPALFISEHWRDGARGAFRMGVEHGLYCLGCCWLLMGLLFLGGVMNLLWIAAIAAFVLLEKVVPAGALGARVSGVVMIVAGVAALADFLI